MTTKYYLLFLSFVAILLFGCSKEDNDKPAIEIEENIVLEKETVDVRIEENSSILISEGNGDYNAFSLNPDIADASITGNNVQILGKSIGSTSIIILDKKNQIKRLPVSVYKYEKIELEKETVDIIFKIGHKKETKVNILSGNGGYSAISKDNTIATVENIDNIILITAQGKEGSTDIVITDMSKRQATITVSTKSTDNPFDDDDFPIKTILEQTTAPYFSFNGTRQNSSSYTYLNTVEDGMNLSGYTAAHNFYTLKIYYPGDKSVGKKEGGKISYSNVPYGESSDGVLDLKYFEIIKNDGEKIWAVFSLTENNVLKYGYFVQNIKP